eukprot:COSAG03_NODE_221_length_10394_cov_15.314036_5_plen_91_part_00
MTLAAINNLAHLLELKDDFEAAVRPVDGPALPLLMKTDFALSLSSCAVNMPLSNVAEYSAGCECRIISTPRPSRCSGRCWGRSTQTRCSP